MVLPNGGTFSVSGESLPRLAAEIDLGVSFSFAGGAELALAYAGKFRENFQDNAFLVDLKYHF
jgi:uncharacterized protein with beta-barrel porin domain